MGKSLLIGLILILAAATTYYFGDEQSAYQVADVLITIGIAAIIFGIYIQPKIMEKRQRWPGGAL